MTFTSIIRNESLTVEIKRDVYLNILTDIVDFFKKIIIVGDNVKKSRYENGIIMSIYDFLLDSNSLEY